MNETNEAVISTAQEPKLSAILNGGSDVLESARIPVQFGVNAALAEIQPTHVLVIIQHESEIGSSHRGIRKLIPLSRGSDFICFESTGVHTVTFVALKKPMDWSSVEDIISRYLKESGPGAYTRYLNIDTPSTSKFGISFDRKEENEYIVAAFSKTISLPEQLFAKKPAGWLWNWVNLWHRYQPDDQCSYRKRMILAFTLKPFAWLLVAIVAKYLWAFFTSLWLLGTKLLVNFLGWRSEPILKDLGKVWSWHWDPDSIDWDITKGSDYGVWSGEKGKEVYYPITGSLFMLLAAIPGLIYAGYLLYLDLKQKDLAGVFFIVTLGSICMGFIVYGLIRSFFHLHIVEQTREDWQARLYERRQKNGTRKLLYFEWLRDVLGTDKLPQRVDLSKVPQAFRNPVSHRFRLSLNATKAKVCKPFPRH